MAKIYRHEAGKKSDYIGRVDVESGYIYSERTGPDKYIGSLDYEKGEIYAHRVGPDKYIGRVDMATGHVYAHRFGPDRYVGRVTPNGKLYRHVSWGRDEQIGTIEDLRNVIEGAAAMLFFFDEKPQEPTEGVPAEESNESTESDPA